jgi:hypothetical protein
MLTAIIAVLSIDFAVRPAFNYMLFSSRPRSSTDDSADFVKLSQPYSIYSIAKKISSGYSASLSGLWHQDLVIVATEKLFTIGRISLLEFSRLSSILIISIVSSISALLPAAGKLFIHAEYCEDGYMSVCPSGNNMPAAFVASCYRSAGKYFRAAENRCARLNYTQKYPQYFVRNDFIFPRYITSQ